MNIVIKVIIICFILLKIMLALKSRPQIAAKTGNPAGLLFGVPANLVFRREIWGARDNGIPPRSTPGQPHL